MNKYLILSEIKNYLFILVGTLSISISLVLFFLQNNITTGGTPGVAILLHHLTNFSIGSMVIIINIPLLILGTKYLGKLFTIRTIITLLLISIFIDFFNSYLKLETLTNNILLSSIFGGVIIGLGVGFIIKGNSSAGGSTIIARILSSTLHLNPANVILVIDFIIIICSIYVFKDIEKALWSIISIYATSKTIDIVLTGTLSTKVIHIVSNKTAKLCSSISKKLGVEGTILKGTRLLNQEDKSIILIVIDKKKLSTLKEIIQDNDPDAFMIVIEASAMLGRGY